ncbi:MAG: hypothetical protein ABIJ65_06550 [Chloroflexota bacterium]
MNTLKKILNFFAWLLTLLLQAALGMVAATFSVAVGQGRMPISLVYTGLGILLGVYLLGALAIAMRKSIQPKKYLPRLVFAFVGMLGPILVLYLVGNSQGYDSEIISGGLGLLMTGLAVLLAIVGFHLPGWFRKK